MNETTNLCHASDYEPNDGGWTNNPVNIQPVDGKATFKVSLTDSHIVLLMLSACIRSVWSYAYMHAIYYTSYVGCEIPEYYI